MGLRTHVAGTVFSLLLVGPFACQTYHAKPLDDAAIDASLRPPSPTEIRERSSDFQHPLLHAIEIDLNRELSPDAIAVLAVLLNPDLRAERDRRDIASAQAFQAGVLPNPQFTGNLDFPFDALPSDSFTAFGVGVTWDVTSLLGRTDRQRAARSSSDSVALDVAWKEWQAAQAARTAAYDVIAFEAQLADGRRADQQFAEGLAVLKRAVEAHDRTVLELSAAEAAYQDAHASMLALIRDLASARIILNRTLGLPSGAAVRLAAAPLPSRIAAPEKEVLSGFESRRLDLLALRRGYDSQDATLRAAILAQFPRINFGVNGGRDTSRVKTVGVNGSIDLPIFDRNQGMIAIETATRQQLYDEYVSRVFAARADLASSLANIRSTNVQLAAAEDALPSFQRLADAYRDALNRGNVDVLSSYTAETTLLQRRIDVTKLKQQLVHDWIAAELAAGQMLPIAAATHASIATTGPSEEAK